MTARLVTLMLPLETRHFEMLLTFPYMSLGGSREESSAKMHRWPELEIIRPERPWGDLMKLQSRLRRSQAVSGYPVLTGVPKSPGEVGRYNRLKIPWAVATVSGYVLAPLNAEVTLQNDWTNKNKKTNKKMWLSTDIIRRVGGLLLVHRCYS